MHLVHRIAKAYGTTPFSLVTSSYAAFDFNRAAYLFGESVEQLLDQRKEETTGSGRHRRTKLVPKYSYDGAIREALKLARARDGQQKHKHIAAIFAALDAG